MARVVPFTDGMQLGLWFNRLTGEVLPSSAVQGTAISALQSEVGGQQVSSDCTTVQEVEALHQSLGITVDAAASYMASREARS